MIRSSGSFLEIRLPSCSNAVNIFPLDKIIFTFFNLDCTSLGIFPPCIPNPQPHTLPSFNKAANALLVEKIIFTFWGSAAWIAHPLKKETPQETALPSSNKAVPSEILSPVIESSAIIVVSENNLCQMRNYFVWFDFLEQIFIDKLFCSSNT